MQVRQTVGQSIAATRTGTPVDAVAPEPVAAATNPVATAGPLSGGKRTVSLGLITEAQEDSDLSPSFVDMVARKTRDFSKTLMSALEAAKIPTDEPITLTLDASGKVTADGPYKERVEKFFKDNPELAKQLKDIAALNSMVAMNEAMRRFTEAKEKAENDEDLKQATLDYTTQSGTIQSLSGTMVLAEGQLTSGAVSYMSSLA